MAYIHRLLAVLPLDSRVAYLKLYKMKCSIKPRIKQQQNVYTDGEGVKGLFAMCGLIVVEAIVYK